MDDAQLAAVDDGRIFTGRQGVGLKLVDELGNEQTARDWLAKEKSVPANTPVRNVSLQPRFGELSFLHLASWTFQAIGLSALAQRIEDWGAVQAVERLNLDGLLALWHPSSSN
jgi:protease-4